LYTTSYKSGVFGRFPDILLRFLLVFHQSECRETGGKRPLGKVRVDVRKILEWVLGRQGGRVWTGFPWLGIGTTVTGFCVFGKELLGSMKDGELLH
jgi:hypothetical protein